MTEELTHEYNDVYFDWLKRLATIRSNLAYETRSAEEILKEWLEKINNLK